MRVFVPCPGKGRGLTLCQMDAFHSFRTRKLTMLDTAWPVPFTYFPKLYCYVHVTQFSYRFAKS